MDEGCLINFESLKEGDTVFSISLGYLIVSEVDYERKRYPIECKSKSNSNLTHIFTKDGKIHEDEVYPNLYSNDPFKYAFNKVREHRVEVYRANQENNKLWTANQQMKKEIEMLRQTKDV